ncbi:MAG: DUF3592 domain-containing protein [Candidatus Heimdallarchaeota archaeon]
MSIIFSIVFFVIGIIIFILILRYIVITTRCSKWPVVIGEVISSEMKPKYKKLAEFAEAVHTVASIYRPDITYTYEIDGEKYTNNTVRPVGRNLYKDKPLVQRVLNLFPEGYKVYIFYNPKNPQNSMLDPWIRFSPVAITVPTALIFLGLGFSFSGFNFLIPLGINFISFALYIASLLIIGQDFRYLVKAIKSKKWPFVEGEIEKVMVYRQKEDRTVSYNVDVTYTYEVQGQKFTNHQIKLDFVHGTRTFVPKIFAMMKTEKYEEGNIINVFYNPHNPNESILEHGLKFLSFFLMLIVGIGLFFFGLFVVQFMIYDLLL